MRQSVLSDSVRLRIVTVAVDNHCSLIALCDTVHSMVGRRLCGRQGRAVREGGRSCHSMADGCLSRARTMGCTGTSRARQTTSASRAAKHTTDAMHTPMDAAAQYATRCTAVETARAMRRFWCCQHAYAGSSIWRVGRTGKGPSAGVAQCGEARETSQKVHSGTAVLATYLSGNGPRTGLASDGPCLSGNGPRTGLA